MTKSLFVLKCSFSSVCFEEKSNRTDHYLLFPNCFQRPLFHGTLISSLCALRVKLPL